MAAATCAGCAALRDATVAVERRLRRRRGSGPRTAICLQYVRPDRFQRIRRQLPPPQADHLDNRRSHLNRQSHDFTHEERPRAGLRVKSARQSDLGVTRPRFVHLCRHYQELSCDRCHEWPPVRASGISRAAYRSSARKAPRSRLERRPRYYAGTVPVSRIHHTIGRGRRSPEDQSKRNATR